MSTVVILQSNYIPWRGYFDLIRKADHFVFYDTVQYTKNDWRNRNRIVGVDGPLWLTIPVSTSGNFGQTIAETRVLDGRWAKKHLSSVQACLGRAPQFRDHLLPVLQGLYHAAAEETELSKINRIFIEGMMGLLGVNTTLHSSADIEQQGDRTGRLVSICKSLGATTYLSGPAAKSYMDVEQFAAADIAIEWMEYPPYPAYRQMNGGYEAGVSILDVMASLPATQVFGQ